MDIKEIVLENEKIKRHPWELARVEIVRYFLNKYRDSERIMFSSILDIGCGDLFLLQKLREYSRNMKLYGVDTAFNNVEIMKIFSQNALKSNIILLKSSEEIELKVTGLVDFILLLDVLEHIESDIRFLKQLLNQKVISYETYFIITVPAFQCLTSSHDNYLGHYRRYTNRKLVENLEECGMDVIESGYFFFTLLLPKIIQRVMEFKKNRSLESFVGIGHWQHNTFVTKFIFWILYCDFKVSYLINKIIKIKIPGLSVFAVCKKRFV